MELKTCTKCKVALTLTQFPKNKRAKSGLGARCKACVSVYGKAWKAANIDRCRAVQAAWNVLNPGRTAATSKAWELSHPDRMPARSRAWYLSHREQVNTNSKTRRQANPEAHLKSVKAWQAANPDKTKSASHKRRALLFGAFVENVSLEVLMQRDHRICGICDLQIAAEYDDRRYMPSLDHIVPLSKGGEHSYANTQPAHLLCNIRKGNREITA